MVKQRVLTIGSSSSVELTINEEINTGGTIVIQNHSSTNNLYIGNENVSTVSYGILVYPESVFSLDLEYIDKLFGISNAADTSISILIVNKD